MNATKTADKGERRTYQNGRSTQGWHRGKKLTRLDEIPVGSHVIKVSHQFLAENLLLIVSDDSPTNKPRRQIAYWRYADNTSGEPFGPEEGAIWDWELAGPSSEFFEALRANVGAATIFHRPSRS